MSNELCLLVLQISFRILQLSETSLYYNSYEPLSLFYAAVILIFHRACLFLKREYTVFLWKMEWMLSSVFMLNHLGVTTDEKKDIELSQAEVRFTFPMGHWMRKNGELDHIRYIVLYVFVDPLIALSPVLEEDGKRNDCVTMKVKD